MKAGDYDAAELEYRNALQLLPDNSEANGRLGALYFSQGKMLPGYLYLHIAVERDLDDPALRLKLGLASLTAARTGEARTSAKKVLLSLPTNELALLLLVNTSVTSRDIEESRRMIEELQQKNPDSGGFHVALGAIQLMKHDLAGAEVELNKALALDPKSAATYGELGTLYWARRDLKKAREAFKQASDLSPVRSAARLNYVDFLLKSGAQDEAAKQLDEITAQAPDFLPAWTVVMQLSYAHQKYDQAVAAAKQILKRDPANYDALVELAQVKIAHKQTDEAIGDFKRLEALYPRVALIKYQLALAYLDKQDIDLARESLTQAVILAPHDDPSILLLAEINLRKNDYQAVVVALEPLIKAKHRLGARAFFLLAQAYHAQGDLPGALAVFEALAQAAPKAPESPYLVGSILNEMGRNAEARAAMEQSLKLSSDYWPAWEGLVDLDLKEGRATESIARLQAVSKQYQKAPTPFLLLAKIAVAANDLKGGEDNLLKAIDLGPNTPYPYLQLARIYVSLKQTQQAVDRLVALTAKGPNLTAMMQLGILEEALGHNDRAREWYEKVLARDPKFVPALNNLAVLESDKLGHLDRGYVLAKRARDLASHDALVEDTLGWIVFKRGDYSGAVSLLHDSSNRSSADPGIQYHAGMAYYMLGQDTGARAAFQKALASGLDAALQDEARRRLAVLDIDPAKPGPEAAARLQDAVRLDPKDPFAPARLGAIQEQAGAFGPAATSFEAALKLAPHSASILAALSNLYFGPLKDPNRARALAQSAHEQAPKDFTISWQLARILYSMHEYSRAINLLQDVNLGLPNEPEVAYDLALAYYGAGRVPDAETALQKYLASDVHRDHQEDAQSMAALIAAAKSPEAADAALGTARDVLAKHPDSIPAQFVSALAQEKKGDFAGAVKSDEAILVQSPQFAPAARQAAILYADKLGNDDKAEELGLKAHKVFTNDPDLEYELGLVYYRKNNFAGAVPFLTRSLSVRGNDPETLFYLGMSHYSLKSNTDARKELKRALELKLPDKDADDATRVLVELDRIEVNR